MSMAGKTGWMRGASSCFGVRKIFFLQNFRLLVSIDQECKMLLRLYNFIRLFYMRLRMERPGNPMILLFGKASRKATCRTRVCPSSMGLTIFLGRVETSPQLP